MRYSYLNLGKNIEKGDIMAFYIDDESVERVKEAADIVSLISEYIPLNKSGANYLGLCPFHSEKTPSFTVSESKQIFHCFGCGQGGDSIGFIMKRENLSFPESVKFLADKYNIQIDETKIDEEKTNRRERAYEINKEAARYFFNNLNNHKGALAYLSKRNIDIKRVRAFGLGYAKDSWKGLNDHLLAKGYREEELEELGLTAKKAKSNGYYDRFRNRIMFPIIDTKGRIIGFGGRVMDDSMPKYLNSKETIVFSKGDNLYGLNLVSKEKNTDKIILVEGYLDVISLFRQDLNYGVASLGTAFTDKQAKLLKRYGNDIYICYDSDLAGIEATKKAVFTMMKEGISPKIIVLGKYKDPDDYFKDHNKYDFEGLMDKALSYIDYKIYIGKKLYNFNVVEEKIKFIQDIAKDIKHLQSPVERDIYMKRVAEEMDISISALEREINLGYNKTFVKKQVPKIVPIKTVLPSANITAEIDLIKIMLYNREYHNKLKDMNIESYIFDKNIKTILFKMDEIYRDTEIIEEDRFLDNMKGHTDPQLIEQIRLRKIQISRENLSQMVKDLIRTIELYQMENKRNEIKQEIKNLEEVTDKTQEEKANLDNLCIRLIEINKSIDLIRYDDGR